MSCVRVCQIMYNIILYIYRGMHVGEKTDDDLPENGKGTRILFTDDLI